MIASMVATRGAASTLYHLSTAGTREAALTLEHRSTAAIQEVVRRLDRITLEAMVVRPVHQVLEACHRQMVPKGCDQDTVLASVWIRTALALALLLLGSNRANRAVRLADSTERLTCMHVVS